MVMEVCDNAVAFNLAESRTLPSVSVIVGR